MTGLRRLLIANRGEIARRIARTARAMGIRVVAVHSQVDAHAAFVEEADLAVALDGPPGRAYLDIEQLLAAARRTGADAVHPGYGFLSERPEFARAVRDAGLTWVGPSPEVIAAMGDKLAARELAIDAGVPVLPGATGDDIPRLVGFPALVKAAAGGGGRGMRRVDGPAELSDALAIAADEAERAFGDPRVFGERLVEPARHVEVQILGDRRGTVRHLFERECSVQRRHQKVLEEAPAPYLEAATRERLWDAAVALASAVRYEGAGTVEFVVAADGDCWFLEMNTRLQVEHPVTEAVTGVDLVRQQLLVAMGEDLDLGGLAVDGAAIEARLYAEDPAAGFAPSTGRLALFRPGSGARVDSGVRTGDEVSSFYDPLLAKVITHAPTRDEAAARLACALEDTRVHGVATNRRLLVDVLRAPAFLTGPATTDFLARHDLAAGRTPPADAVRRAAVAAALAGRRRRMAQRDVLPALPPGWRNTPAPGEVTAFEHQGSTLQVAFFEDGTGTAGGTCDGHPFSATLARVDLPDLDLLMDGVRCPLTVVDADHVVYVQGPDLDVRLVELPRFPRRSPVASRAQGELVTTTHGVVAEFRVSPGDRVHAGQIVAVIESMKLLQPLTASVTGTVRAISAGVGSTVAPGDVLVVVDPQESPTDG